MTSLLDLPAELFAMVLPSIEKIDLKSVRLACQHLNLVVTPYLFEEIVIVPQSQCIRGLTDVIRGNRKLGLCIRYVKYELTPLISYRIDQKRERTSPLVDRFGPKPRETILEHLQNYPHLENMVTHFLEDSYDWVSRGAPETPIECTREFRELSTLMSYISHVEGAALSSPSHPWHPLPMSLYPSFWPQYSQWSHDPKFYERWTSELGIDNVVVLQSLGVIDSERVFNLSSEMYRIKQFFQVLGDRHRMPSQLCLGRQPLGITSHIQDSGAAIFDGLTSLKLSIGVRMEAWRDHEQFSQEHRNEGLAEIIQVCKRLQDFELSFAECSSSVSRYFISQPIFSPLRSTQLTRLALISVRCKFETLAKFLQKQPLIEELLLDNIDLTHPEYRYSVVQTDASKSWLTIISILREKLLHLRDICLVGVFRSPQDDFRVELAEKLKILKEVDKDISLRSPQLEENDASFHRIRLRHHQHCTDSERFWPRCPETWLVEKVYDYILRKPGSELPVEVANMRRRQIKPKYYIDRMFPRKHVGDCSWQIADVREFRRRCGSDMSWHN